MPSGVRRSRPRETLYGGGFCIFPGARPPRFLSTALPLIPGSRLIIQWATSPSGFFPARTIAIFNPLLIASLTRCIVLACPFQVNCFVRHLESPFPSHLPTFTPRQCRWEIHESKWQTLWNRAIFVNNLSNVFSRTKKGSDPTSFKSPVRSWGKINLNKILKTFETYTFFLRQKCKANLRILKVWKRAFYQQKLSCINKYHFHLAWNTQFDKCILLHEEFIMYFHNLRHR